MPLETCEKKAFETKGSDNKVSKDLILSHAAMTANNSFLQGFLPYTSWLPYMLAIRICYFLHY